MKRSIVAIALAMAGLAACDPKVPAEPDQARASEQAGAEAATPAAKTIPAEPAARGAPAYAALYPGAEATAPATLADGPDGPGGMVEFRTSAAPDAVVDFYRQRAQAAGLAPVSAMDQGETRAWSAAKTDNGASVSVVASPSEGATSVQLSWSAGR